MNISIIPFVVINLHALIPFKSMLWGVFYGDLLSYDFEIFFGLDYKSHIYSLSYQMSSVHFCHGLVNTFFPCSFIDGIAHISFNFMWVVDKDMTLVYFMSFIKRFIVTLWRISSSHRVAMYVCVRVDLFVPSK